MKKFLIRLLYAVFCLSLVVNQTSSAAAQNTSIKLVASTVVKDLIAKNKQNPELSAKALADFGNSILAKKGFNYEFDICELLRAKNEAKQLMQDGELLIFPYAMNLSNSSKTTF